MVLKNYTELNKYYNLNTNIIEFSIEKSLLKK